MTRMAPGSEASPCSVPAGAPGPPLESDPVEASTLATRRLHAVSAFLLNHESVLLVLASHFRGRGAVFESAILGSSMSPAVPSRARLRVRLLGEEPCRSGDVVYYLANDGYMVHRVLYQPRRGAAAGYLLTRGDRCVAPDPPVRKDRILGTVIAVQTAGGWRPPGPPMSGSVYHRVIRAITLTATIAALWLSVSAARRLAAVLLKLESAARGPAERFLRRLRLTPSER